MPFNPKSLDNLGKQKTKAGRKNFSLSLESFEWLSLQPNQSQSIDNLIKREIMNTINQVAVHVVEFNSQVELIKKIWTLIDPTWESNPGGDGSAVSDKTTVAEGLSSPYEFGDKMREAIDCDYAAINCVNLHGYYALGSGANDERGVCKVAIYKPNLV